MVLHARKGGGASVDGEAISVFEAKEPKGSWLASLPGSFGGRVPIRWGDARQGRRRSRCGQHRLRGGAGWPAGCSSTASSGGRAFGTWSRGVALAAEANGIVMQQRPGSGFLGITPAHDPLGCRRVTGPLVAERRDDDGGLAQVVDAAGHRRARRRALRRVEAQEKEVAAGRRPLDLLQTLRLGGRLSRIDGNPSHMLAIQMGRPV